MSNNELKDKLEKKLKTRKEDEIYFENEISDFQLPSIEECEKKYEEGLKKAEKIRDEHKENMEEIRKYMNLLEKTFEKVVPMDPSLMIPPFKSTRTDLERKISYVEKEKKRIYDIRSDRLLEELNNEKALYESKVERLNELKEELVEIQEEILDLEIKLSKIA